MFLWFNTRARLLRFLADYEGPDSEYDQDNLRLTMRKVASQILAGRLGFQKGRLKFNALLKGHIQIEWMGHFDELLSGNQPFSKMLRVQFLQVEEQRRVPTIETTDVKDFIEYLRDYGH